jgi:predicted nucleotidyltransferase
MSPVSAEQMAVYRRTARARWQAEQQQRAERYQRARQLAHQAAQRLKAQFDVQRVVLFGSATQPDRFNEWSDVDLAVWGLTSANWLKASAAVRDLSNEIEINVVDVTCCSPELLTSIEREGVEI